MPAKKKFRPVIQEMPQSYAPLRGRGASWSPANRFEKLHLDLTDINVVDGDVCAEEQQRRATQYFRDGTKSVITRNSSPDVGFETSLNPYRGCEHGCIYCYARPTHEYLGFSAGLDFESKIMVKTNAPELLRAANIAAGVMVAPIIPGLTDHEVPKILEACAKAGAQFAGYTIIRLPWAVAPLFEHWLDEHFPERKEKVLGRIRAIRGDRLNNSQWHTRMTGEGFFAEQIASLFKVSCHRVGIGQRPRLSCESFRRSTTQLCLFG